MRNLYKVSHTNPNLTMVERLVEEGGAAAAAAAAAAAVHRMM